MVRRIVLAAIALLLTLALVGGALLYWSAKRAEPSYGGELVLAGLQAPVTVRYGPHAVPSVEAEGLADLLFAQGYLTAAERMWQMDMMRRLAKGELAEVLGADAVPADRLFRTLGLAQAARETLAALEPEYQEMLAAYAAGVNAYQAEAHGRPPLEYLIARFDPAPWRPEDSLAIAEHMAWMLSFNLREELAFLRLAARVGAARATELFPVDEGISASVAAARLPAPAVELARAFDDLLALPARYGLPGPGAASNGWAVNGPRTADGAPLFANDPHLAPTLPSIWYELELRSPELHAAGVSMPGVPFVLIGHNPELAWGFTTVMADTQDLFIERVASDGAEVDRPGGAREAIASRGEEIRVRGQDPVRIEIRSTSHGVVINDVLGEATGTAMDLRDPQTPYLLALRSNLDLADRGLVGMHRLNTATTLDEALAAGLEIRRASFNLMVAHRDGGIGWRVTGALPERGRGLGTFPAPGWEAGYGWAGYVPADDNPGLVNPPGYALITANNRTVPAQHPVHITSSWMAPFRARRIDELLGRRDELQADDLAEMQLDRLSLQARDYQKALVRLGPEIRVIDPQARRIADEYLMGWDGRFDGDRRAAALFVLLRLALFEALFGDELEDDLPALLGVASLSYNALDAAIYSGESNFWDDVRTAEVEGQAHVWARALRVAKAELDRTQPERGGQRLDRLLSVTFPHAFHRLPLLGGLFSLGPIPVGGDEHTVNVVKASLLAPGEAVFVPTMRVVFTPADWSETRGTLALGQSGHRFSPYRADQLGDWLEGRAHPWPWNGPAPGAQIGALVLRPIDLEGASRRSDD
jgi:acyl-homoserine lactone acylase PvdQ